MREVWGWDFGDLSTVTVHVRRLRGKVEDDPARPRLIQTVWGVGYRFDGTEAAPRPATAGPPHPASEEMPEEEARS
jgi:DNA-binding winged helix-turn-helix (wHTH) protein